MTSVALLAVSVAISAAGAIQAGKAQADAQKFNATLARQQAEREREIAGQQAADFRRRAGRRLATARALRAGSGVTIEGTPLLVQESRAADSELGARRIEASGASAATREETRANLSEHPGPEHFDRDGLQDRHDPIDRWVQGRRGAREIKDPVGQLGGYRRTTRARG